MAHKGRVERVERKETDSIYYDIKKYKPNEEWKGSVPNKNRYYIEKSIQDEKDRLDKIAQNKQLGV